MAAAVTVVASAWGQMLRKQARADACRLTTREQLITAGIPVIYIRIRIYIRRPRLRRIQKKKKKKKRSRARSRHAYVRLGAWLQIFQVSTMQSCARRQSISYVTMASSESFNHCLLEIEGHNFASFASCLERYV